MGYVFKFLLMGVISKLLIFHSLFADEIPYSEFIKMVERHSIELERNFGMANSLKSSKKADLAFNYSSVELTSSTTKAPNLGTTQTNISALFMIAPKLPWVSSAISEFYAARISRVERYHDLLRNLVVIGAKRVYLTYMILNERHQVLIDREQNSKEMLDISKQRFDSGRISKSEYIRWEGEYIAAKLDLQKSVDMLNSTRNFLRILAGRDDFIIKNMHFFYPHMDRETLNKKLEKSPYVELLEMDLVGYDKNINLIRSNKYSGFQIGAGFSTSPTQNSIEAQIIVPLPITSKTSHMVASVMALKNSLIKEVNLTKITVQENGYRYYDLMLSKGELLKMQREYEESKRNLSNISKIGFDAGVVSAFEYIATKNEYLNAALQTIDAKIDYVNNQSFLEESLGELLDYNNNLAGESR